MPVFAIVTGAITGLAFLFFIGIILSTLIGGIIGWVVSLVFPFVITTLNQLAGTQLTAFETGAVLGFFSSFFRNFFPGATTKSK